MTTTHQLSYLNGDDDNSYGSPDQRLAVCSCGAKDGRWFRKGAKATRQGAAFMAKHQRQYVDPFAGNVDVKSNDGWDT